MDYGKDTVNTIFWISEISYEKKKKEAIQKQLFQNVYYILIWFSINNMLFT